MACPAARNGGVIASMGATPKLRKKLYTGICVPGRLLVVCLILVLAYEAPVSLARVALVGGMIAAAANLITASDASCRWWAPGANAVYATAIAATGAAVLAKKITPELGGIVFALLFAASVFTGVAIYAWAKPFDATP
jgi:hypothetical protein